MARSTTSAERLLTLFRDNARRVSSRGLSHLKIEDGRLVPGRITVGGESIHNFGDCSYLGLGADPRLAAGAKSAIDRFGTSYSSSIAYTAVPLYRDLQERFVEIMGVPVALAPTTTLAHAAALPVLVRPTDVVLMDSAVHNSVQMSVQLLAAAGTAVHSVPHGDLAALDRLIAETEGADAPAIWYLADGVYSMSGAAAPFEEIRARLDAHPTLRAYVDDAHGLSWAGTHGRGLALDRMGWHDRLVITAGLAKGFGSAGGIVASPDPELIELVEVCGPPLTFGGPLTPPTLGAAIASADIHLSNELAELQAGVVERIDLVNRYAHQLGVPLLVEDRTPIFFVQVGRVDVMMDIGSALVADGFYLNPAAWPAVPHRRAGLRFTVTNSLPMGAIEAMLERLHRHLKDAGALEELTVDLRGEQPVVDVRDRSQKD
jgi:7-keto-8-aminopelargonate synthetase-like enzyme